jgi:hypothetical protein
MSSARETSRSATHNTHVHRASFALLVALSLVLGALMWGIRFDDPYITYRFADNLVRGLGFTFNPADVRNPLITTAPLYALLLSLPGALGIPVPLASSVIGIGAIAVAACTLHALVRSKNGDAFGLIAGVFFITFPLMWLTLGFETPLFLAVATLAFVCIAHEKSTLTGLLLGVAMGLRGDGAIVLGVIGLWLIAQFAFTRNRVYIKHSITVILFAAVAYAPLAIFLTLNFGSPLPTTLQTKSAQAVSGLTGFYVGTSFLEGALILLRAYLAQTPLFAVVILLMAFGVIGVLRMLLAHDSSPILLPILWAVVHFTGYTIIRVAPYPWYYAPMVPGIACLMVLGVDLIVHFVPQQRALAHVFIGTVATIPLVIGCAHIAAVLRGATPPQPAEIGAKVLPEAKVDVYEQVGRWVNANTPTTATLGVTELGVMSYFAQRNTVDFLGLTRPQSLGDIRRGDYLAGLLREQPDYLALTSWNSLYDDAPQEDAWFRAIYTQVAAFDDPRFWGTPMTVWQRTTSPITNSIVIAEGAWDLGEGWQVTSVAVSTREVDVTTPLIVRVRLKALWQPSTGQNTPRTLRVQPITVQRGDGLPSWSRPIQTHLWRAGDEAWVDFPILPFPDSRSGTYDINVRWEDGGPDVFAGQVRVP